MALVYKQPVYAQFFKGDYIVFALGVKFCFMIAALVGYATMWMAVFADTGVCLIVVAWGLRLMKCAGKVDMMLGAA